MDWLSDSVEKALAAASNKRDLILDVGEWIKTIEDDKRDDGFHISNLFSLCQRREGFKHLMPRTEEKDPAKIFRLWIGKVLHAFLQSRIFGPMGVLEGYFVCLECKWKTTELGTRPEKCGQCVGTAFRYKEIKLQYEDGLISGKYKIVGATDGVILKNGKREGFEIKTANKEVIMRLKNEPMPEHKFQLDCYIYLLNKIYNMNISTGIILYIDPSGLFKNKGYPMIQFNIKHDPSAFEIAKVKVLQVIQLYERIAKKETIALPERELCASPFDPHAKWCPYKEACFSSFLSTKLQSL